MSQWFYAKAGQQLGPVDESQLRQMLSVNILALSDLIWREGMARWEPASTCFPDLVSSMNMRAGMPGPPPVPQGQTGTLGYYSSPPAQLELVGFWWRVLAAMIDGLITSVAGLIIQLIIFLPLGVPMFGYIRPGTVPSATVIIAGIVNWILNSTMHWLYEALMTCSTHQGTLGKMACGIKVTNLTGEPISFGRATGRHFAKILSAIIIFIGFIMVAFTQRKQGLHDIICETLVVRKPRPSLPQ